MTKTITLKQEAYEKLRAARRYPTESFSEVVMRAKWPEDTITAGELLRLYRSGGPRLPKGAADLIERFQRLDKPPVNKWDKA
jgi:hypothetical protein